MNDNPREAEVAAAITEQCQTCLGAGVVRVGCGYCRRDEHNYCFGESVCRCARAGHRARAEADLPAVERRDGHDGYIWTRTHGERFWTRTNEPAPAPSQSVEEARLRFVSLVEHRHASNIALLDDPAAFTKEHLAEHDKNVEFAWIDLAAALERAVRGKE